MLLDTNTALTIGPLAIQLGCLEGHIRKLANRGKIPFGTLRGMRVFRVSDIPEIRLALAEAGYLRSAAEAAGGAAHAS